MYVPNYVPQPIEVPGNVAEQRWKDQLLFLRRVAVWHLASVAVVAFFAMRPLPTPAMQTALGCLAGSILSLSLIRIGTRGTAWDQRFSLAVAPLMLASLAIILREAFFRFGLPLWSPLFGIGATALYTVFCRRDFSFVGQYMLSLIVSTVALALVALGIGMPSKMAGWAIGLNALYLSFFCYDLASLMSRRRLGEEPAAAVDLYRDVLNFFGYAVRCVRHWKRHKIWAAPWA